VAEVTAALFCDALFQELWAGSDGARQERLPEIAGTTFSCDLIHQSAGMWVALSLPLLCPQRHWMIPRGWLRYRSQVGLCFSVEAGNALRARIKRRSFAGKLVVRQGEFRRPVLRLDRFMITIDLAIGGGLFSMLR